MVHQQPALPGIHSRTLSSSLAWQSAQSRFQVLSLLLVAALMTALMAFINLAGISPSLPALTQTASLPATYIPSPLLSKPELVHLRSSNASHFDLGNGRRLAVVGAAPQNYQDAAGNWQPIQPGFAQVEGGWRVDHNTLRSTFAGDSTAVQLESEGQVFGWQPVALEIDEGDGPAQELAVPLPGDAVQAEGLGSLLSYANAWSDATLVEQFHSSAGRLEQELILAQAPALVPARAPAGEGQWLSLRVDLALPAGVRIVANGQTQTGEFTTHGVVQFQQAGGTPLLALDPPQAYEQGDRSASTAGRYRVVPHGDGLTLWVQTPLAWWLAAERSYPAVLDPTMHVLRDMQSATIRYPYNKSVPNAKVLQQACVGLIDGGIMGGGLTDSLYDRGYVRFKLPSLPDGALPTKATLVGVPEPSRRTSWPAGPNEYTLVHRVTMSWISLQAFPSVPAYTDITHAPETDRKQIPYVWSSEFDPDERPATTWEVTDDVKMWYQNPSMNHGFALESEYDGQHLDADPGEAQFFNHCFPPSSLMDLDDVVDNPTDPTSSTPGLGLLIEYDSPLLLNNERREVTVPSTQPRGIYKNEYHEYGPLPYAYGWQLVGVRGSSAWVNDGLRPNTPLWLTEKVPSDLVLSGNPIVSDLGGFVPGNQAMDYQPNYVVVNSYHRGAQTLPNDLVVHVGTDPKTDHTDDDKKMYHIQIADAATAVALEVEVPAIVPIHLGDGFLVGQEFNFPVDTTVEIKIPYPGSFQSHHFNIQLFPPTAKYGSRAQNGMQLTPGPHAWEIEFQVKPEHSGEHFDTWLLAVVYDNEFPNNVTFNAEVMACPNRPDVVVFPMDGACVELRKPPIPVPDDDPLHLFKAGKVRIYSPAGFTDSCSDGTCTTKAVMDEDGTAVAALIGFEGDDYRWVALKGGQFEIVGGTIRTTPDVRLVMADFSAGESPITLPVLRGRFEVDPTTTTTTGRMAPIPGPDPTYLLVKTPLHEQDVVGPWDYFLKLSEARMWASGQVSRIIEPTEPPATTLDFDAQWSITARGGLDLLGAASLSNTPGDFQVGTLIVTPPVAGYSIEHNPEDADASSPAVMPKFKHIRMTGATLSQPYELGGAQVPVQAVILPPSQSVVDEDEVQVKLHCGTSCFDLRGEADAMLPDGPHTVRQYRMPDLIIQDQAGTVMINTPQGVEIYSRDHPESRLALNGGDYSFNYEAFGATISTYQGPCPLPRNPLDPTVVPGGIGAETTVVEGEAILSLPNAESESGGSQIGITFRLCENSLREMSFIFNTGKETALPLGNSGLFLNFVKGTISLTPGQGPDPAYTTVVLEVAVRGMSADAASSNVFIKGVVTIDTRGLFDMQLNAGLKVVGGYGVGVDGHFWVAWAPLDLGFDVQACAPYKGGFDAVTWLGNRCQGNELLFGMLRAHLWQGQGWQNQYHWLPDNDDVHIAARYKVSINLAAGMIVDWEFIVIPPTDMTLWAVTLAFGEFCTNDACTAYEWGVTGAYTLLDFDFGIYYGFDSGLDFILGSGGYLLIDEAGQAFTGGLSPAHLGPQAGSPYNVTIPAGTPSAMFVLGWDPGVGGEEMDLILAAPDDSIIDKNTVDPNVTVTVSPTVKGMQTMIVVEDPLPGEWQITMTGTDPLPLPPHNFTYFANNPQLSLSVTHNIPEPGAGHLEPGDVVHFEWESNISDAQNAWLSLYYSVTNPLIDGSQEIGGPIVERLPLALGTYEWEVQGLAYVDNEYHVYARIDSDAAAEVNACGPDHEYNPDPTTADAGCAMLNSELVLPVANITGLAMFFYEDQDPPSNPILVGAQGVDWTSVMVLWRPNAEVDLAGYLVRCEQPGIPVNVRTVRTAAVHVGGAKQFESALVNGLLPYQTATCSLRAYDTSGNVSGYSSSATAEPEVVISEAVIDEEIGATLVSVDEQIVAQFPPGMVESKTLVKLTRRTGPPQPIGPLEYAGASFDLSAYSPTGAPVTHFMDDFTLDVAYGGPGLGIAGSEVEQYLNLYWWDGGAWRGVLPCNGCSHDTEGQTFTVVLDHLTEFAVLAGDPPPVWHLYLPLIIKAE